VSQILGTSPASRSLHGCHESGEVVHRRLDLLSAPPPFLPIDRGGFQALSAEQAEAFETVATVERRAISEVILAKHIEAGKKDGSS